jgi:hypothetical protein
MHAVFVSCHINIFYGNISNKVFLFYNWRISWLCCVLIWSLRTYYSELVQLVFLLHHTWFILHICSCYSECQRATIHLSGAYFNDKIVLFNHRGHLKRANWVGLYFNKRLADSWNSWKNSFDVDNQRVIFQMICQYNGFEVWLRLKL